MRSTLQRLQLERSAGTGKTANEHTVAQRAQAQSPKQAATYARCVNSCTAIAAACTRGSELNFMKAPMNCCDTSYRRNERHKLQGSWRARTPAATCRSLLVRQLRFGPGGTSACTKQHMRASSTAHPSAVTTRTCAPRLEQLHGSRARLAHLRSTSSAQ